MAVTLSLPEARRLAVAAQGFGARPSTPSVAHLRRLAERVHAFQIDSVNVLIRAHYVPAFARLGPYRTDALDSLAYRKRALFEYWGHEACLMPISMYPLVRHRMHKHSEQTQDYMRSGPGSYMARVYAEVAERGPIAASQLADPGKRSAGWWGWWRSGNGKATLEHLYDSGLVAIAGRRGFERLYDLTERIIPGNALEAPALPQEEAMKVLICRSAKAQGVGTYGDITAYFHIDGWRDRMPPGPAWTWDKRRTRRRAEPIARRLIAELVEEGRLLLASIPGWNESAYLHPEARVPKSVDARAFVTPFDSLVWERSRIKRLFGMSYTIEMYTPPAKRVFGYYVCPFLLGDTLVARCDLKADRSRKILMVQSAFLEPGQHARGVIPAMVTELRHLQAWLELDGIEVGHLGDLAGALSRSVKRARGPRKK
jgi:uncharacterized protein YcaQ